MNRRNFVTQLLSIPVGVTCGVLVSAPGTVQNDIVWTESCFDWGNQFAIAGEYNGLRQAVRIHKRVEEVTDTDRLMMKQQLIIRFRRDI